MPVLSGLPLDETEATIAAQPGSAPAGWILAGAKEIRKMTHFRIVENGMFEDGVRYNLSRDGVEVCVGIYREVDNYLRANMKPGDTSIDVYEGGLAPYKATYEQRVAEWEKEDAFFGSLEDATS
jgi:hypothetical protein